ncbi:uncharacterized protein [Lolium perenne]|uniref:uncharacterized protein isoform X2 n=1 Tax=Lolium perenne TaxID=4522 RepID=UPI003A99DE45
MSSSEYKVLTGRAPSPAGWLQNVAAAARIRPAAAAVASCSCASPVHDARGTDGTAASADEGGAAAAEWVSRKRRPNLDGRQTTSTAQSVSRKRSSVRSPTRPSCAGKGEATGRRALRGSLPTPSGSAPNSLSPGSCGRQRRAVGLLLEEDES